MFEHTKRNRGVADECLKRISSYEYRMKNNVWDDFYMYHLDCFTDMIKDWKEEEKSCFAVICMISGTVPNKDEEPPLYGIVCTPPNWETSGVMFTSNMYDATKFDLFSEDLVSLAKTIKNKYPNKDVQVLKIPKVVFGNNPREVWFNNTIRRDFEDYWVSKWE